MVARSAAVLAGAAWLNAKYCFFYDYILARALISALFHAKLVERQDRVNLFYVLEKHATTRSTAASPFLVGGGREWTFKEVYDTVLQYAAWLKMTYAIAPKDVVAIDFVNGPHFVFFWLALWSLGALPAFINYNLTGQPLLHCIKISTTRILFVDGESESKVTQEVSHALESPDFRVGGGSVQIVIVDGDLERRIRTVEGMREPDASRKGVKGSDMAKLIYTSGTTGLPKAAIISWTKATMGSMFVSSWLGMKQSDRFYTVSRSAFRCCVAHFLSS